VSSLRAPIAVTVEVRAAGRRASNVGEDGLALERPAPFERGRPVVITFAMPGGAERVSLNARVEAGAGDDDEEGDREGRSTGGRELAFLAIGEEDRERLRGYVTERLGLPEMPG